MADHQEMIHPAAAATTGSSTSHGHGHGGDWWSTAVSCSPDQLPGFGAAGGWTAAAADGGGNRSRSGNAASSESPGSNSLATGGSSITFQEPAGGVADPGGGVVPHPATGLAAGWNQPYYLDGSGNFHGYMSSSRGDQGQLGLRSPSSNYSLMLQDSHDPNHQFLSNLGFELLSSPTSPSGGFRSSSLLRSLTEPSAAAKPSLGFQQYQQQAMNQAPPSSIREALQFTNNTPFWNPANSTGFMAAAAAAEGAASLGTAGPPSGQSNRPVSLAAKSALEGAGDSSSIITKKAGTDPTPLKKARTGTPLPTFKVRKEKLGDRITALQQLVSPFGKTDTASVLHETIEYIKFLHEQVGSLSAPYLKNRQQVPHLKISRDGGEAAAVKGDLTGRGLCLVPISSTFAVASETPVDFWSPFGAAFR